MSADARNTRRSSTLLPKLIARGEAAKEVATLAQGRGCGRDRRDIQEGGCGDQLATDSVHLPPCGRSRREAPGWGSHFDVQLFADYLRPATALARGRQRTECVAIAHRKSKFTGTVKVMVCPVRRGGEGRSALHHRLRFGVEARKSRRARQRNRADIAVAIDRERHGRDAAIAGGASFRGEALVARQMRRHLAGIIAQCRRLAGADAAGLRHMRGRGFLRSGFLLQLRLWLLGRFRLRLPRRGGSGFS